jgi:hypothetical protein
MQHARRGLLDVTHEIGNRRLATQAAKNVDVVLGTARQEAWTRHVIERRC